MNEDIERTKREFLEGEVMLLTLNAGLSTRDRSFKVYRDGLNDDRKDEVRKAIHKKLSDFSMKACSEEAHVKNIQKIADDLTGAFGDYLHNARFRIGISQKLLNLYLKYLWVLDRIPEPWHCPFDSVVIRELDLTPRPNWTSIDSIEEYQLLVAAARRAASKGGFQSVATWELYVWSRQDSRVDSDLPG